MLGVGFELESGVGVGILIEKIRKSATTKKSKGSEQKSLKIR